ncbi:cytochrome P450 [Streptomyces sp. NPDC058548]|uniref:cytochrome P450 n=1 Tax=unclassified Streptomyces TaxID=2593676 RepID=UPI003651624E
MSTHSPVIATDPPLAPGRVKLLGHLPRLARDPIGYLGSLSSVGEVVGLRIANRPVYVVTSPELVRALLVEHASVCTRGSIFRKAGQVMGQGLVIAEGSLHRRQRRLVQPAFHQRRIERYADTMAEVAAAHSRSWQDGRPFEAAAQLHAMGLEMICRGLFRSGLAEHAAARVERAVPAVVRGIIWRTLYPADWLERLPIPVNRRFDRARQVLHTVVDEIITTYRATEPEEGDVLALLLDARDQDSGQPMSDEQLRDEIVTLILTGTETTATTLAWLFHELDHHPEVDERLAAELTEVLGDRPVRFEDLARLPYTGQVLKETLRLHTPNWLLTRRATREFRLGRHRIPAGAELLFSLTALHRDPALYPDPRRFDPDRWTAERSAGLPSHAFLPFGAGKHKCIGDVFAMTEMLVAAATVLRDWRPVHTDSGRPVGERPWTTVQPGGLRLTPLARRRFPRQRQGGPEGPSRSGPGTG